MVEGRAFVRGKLGRWAIGIEDGRIAEISRTIRGDERMDLGDLIILPGAIDPHVHFRDPGMTDKEDFSTGTLAAACGGVTTVLDMPNTLPPAVSADKLAEKKEAIARKAWVDYGLFGGCMPGGRIEQMAPMVVGFKVFMGSSTGRLLVTDNRDLARIAQQMKRTGKVLSVHAEDEGLIQHEAERSLADHLRNRPAAAEVSAIGRLSSLDCDINVCHVTSAEGLKAVEPLPFTTEVTAHHLLLDRDSEGGAYLKVNPPLRTKEDRLALFQAFVGPHRHARFRPCPPHHRGQGAGVRHRPVGRSGCGDHRAHHAGPHEARDAADGGAGERHGREAGLEVRSQQGSSGGRPRRRPHGHRSPRRRSHKG